MKLGKIFPVSNLGIDEVSFVFNRSPYEKGMSAGHVAINDQVADVASVNRNLVENPNRKSHKSLQSLGIDFRNPIAVNISEFEKEFGSYHDQAKNGFKEFRFGYPIKKFEENFLVMEGEWQEERYWKDYAIVLRVQSVSKKVAQVRGFDLKENLSMRS